METYLVWFQCNGSRTWWHHWKEFTSFEDASDLASDVYDEEKNYRDSVVLPFGISPYHPDCDSIYQELLRANYRHTDES